MISVGLEAGFLEDFQSEGISGGGYLPSWFWMEERGSRLAERMKPSRGRRPSWQRRKVELDLDLAAFLEMKTGFAPRRGFAELRVDLVVSVFFFFLSPPMTRL